VSPARNYSSLRSSLAATTTLTTRSNQSKRASFEWDSTQLTSTFIHWPNPLEDHYVEAWSALIEARNRGLVRYIGVSNFLPEHLERLGVETGELPAVNQIELHPYWPQVELVEFHRGHGIITEAWSPLERAAICSPVLSSPPSRTNTSHPAQTVLAWHLHNGAIPIPKATAVERQHENLDIFGFP